MIHPYGGLEQMKYGGYSKGLVKIDFKNIFFKKKNKCIFVREKTKLNAYLWEKF